MFYDEWYSQPINPADYGVYAHNSGNGLRAQIRITLRESDASLIEKLRNSLDSQGYEQHGLALHFWTSTQTVSNAKLELASRIIRAHTEPFTG